MVVTDIKTSMEEAVAEVLEAMCFTSVEGSADDGEGGVQADWICGELDFVGYPNGAFGIAVPPQTAAIVAANFLGDDDSELSEGQIIEVVCELTNMICGSLLSHLDPQKAFTLSPPRHNTSAFIDGGGETRISGTYRLDEGFIYSWIEVREQS